MVENVVIVAGGKNTRFKEMSIFPKILLPYENYGSILYYDYKCFKYTHVKVYLVINEMYAEMVKQYVKNSNMSIDIIVSSNTEGSANTLAEVQDELPKNNVLFLWSDLILDKAVYQKLCSYDFDSLSENNFVITYPGNYRYRATKNNIIQVSQDQLGNVPGIYFCKKLKTIAVKEKFKHGQNYDFLEWLYSQEEKPGTVDYRGNITEFKDLEVYLDYFKKLEPIENITRYFNVGLKLESGVYRKKCLFKEFFHLIEKEIDWYNKVNNKKLKCIPEIYSTDKDNHCILMEYLKDYKPLYKFLGEPKDKKEFNSFLNNYVEFVEELHDSEKKEVDKLDLAQDCEIEFYEKVISRCNKISGILYNYSESELKRLLDIAVKYIISQVMDKNYPRGVYYFTHGDLNGSNVMYNPNSKTFKFIDPRGYFGKTEMLGLKEYDYAKILYCLSGYDNFNIGRFLYTKDWKTPVKELIGEDFILNNKIKNPVTKIMVSIIWIALAQYIAQDVFKANIAYEHGFEMLKENLKELKLID